MPRTSPTVIIISLTAVGVVACALSAPSLLVNGELQTPLNPLGINRSPYGEVFAMALQGPISTNFYAGMYGISEEEAKVANQAANNQDSKAQSDKNSEEKTAWSLMGSMESLMTKMQQGHAERTNPYMASDALKFYLRRQAEDKLWFAYHLDPSHYANYNSLHFFMVEGIGTRPELISSAKDLADETIDYCLKQQDDPRPLLTAAAASINVLHIMFSANRQENSSYSTEDMRFYLKKLDNCILQYESMAQEWNTNGNWQRISSQRFNECAERYEFITNIRNIAEKTIIQVEKQTTH